MKNKHHDVLVAWAEGRPIQVRYGDDPWITVYTENCQCLDFSSGGDISKFKIEWRVKPEPPWYRVALMRLEVGFFTATADDCTQEADLERDKWFVRWLTDRISYEV